MNKCFNGSSCFYSIVLGSTVRKKSFEGVKRLVTITTQRLRQKVVPQKLLFQFQVFFRPCIYRRCLTLKVVSVPFASRICLGFDCIRWQNSFSSQWFTIKIILSNNGACFICERRTGSTFCNIAVFIRACKNDARLKCCKNEMNTRTKLMQAFMLKINVNCSWKELKF